MTLSGRFGLIVTKHRALLAVLILGLAARVIWMMNWTRVIENEGGGYAFTSEAWLKGNGFIQIGPSGPSLMQSPMYSVMIAAVCLVTQDSELAGRLVSLVSGLLLIGALYFLAFRVYGQRQAVVAGILAACHPLLIGFSVAVYSEMTSIGFTMVGLLLVLQFLQSESCLYTVLAGACFGISYLSRPEWIFCPFISVGMIVVVSRIRRKDQAPFRLASLLLVLTFLILAIPYIAFLFRHTGHIRLEGKSLINYTIGRRIDLGMSYPQAAYEIAEDLTVRGPLLDPNRFVTASPFSRGISDLVHYAWSSLKRNRASLGELMLSPTLGSPFLLGLVLLGLFGEVWDVERFIHEGFLQVVVLLILLVLLTAHTLFLRYVLSLLPFFLLWASNGIISLSVWARNSSMNLLLTSAAAKRVGVGVLVGCVFMLIVYPALHVSWVSELEQAKQGTAYLRDAGLWIRAHSSKSKRIMDNRTVIPYYASGTLLSFPYCNSETALRYIASKSPDFIVLDGQIKNSRPYLGEWLDKGIPDTRAKLIYEAATEAGSRIKIFEWSRINQHAEIPRRGSSLWTKGRRS